MSLATAVFLVVVTCFHGYAEVSFRIVAPQTICGKAEKSDNITSNSEEVLISLQPRNGEKLHYKFQLFFKTTENRSQRKTLQIWHAVRDLEKKLNVESRENISAENLISIGTYELIPSVDYYFHITGTSEKNETSEEKYFQLAYTDGKLKHNDAQEDLNFNLIGSEALVASQRLMITALVKFCKPKFEYYLSWKMLGLDEEHQDLLHVSGSLLKMPEYTLMAGKDYTVEATLLGYNNSKELAKDSFTIKVAKQHLLVAIFPSEIEIGIERPTMFELVVENFNINDEIQVDWECLDEKGGKCEGGIVQNQTKFDIAFKGVGSYKIKATITSNEIDQAFVVSQVNVVPNTIIQFEYAYIPKLFLNENSELNLNLLVQNLIPKCQAMWSVSGNNEHVKDISKLFLEVIIKDQDELYLSEITEFGNSTINKELPLEIPKNLLKGDELYKFSLKINCPGFYNSPVQNTTSSLTFEVQINAAPVASELEINPEEGLALKTSFQLSSGGATDKFEDTPLTYEFYIKVENLKIKYGTFIDHKEVSVLLPYSDNIEVFYKVCDNRDSCSIIQGPPVKVLYEEFTSEEMNLRASEITNSFQRMDLVNAQRQILLMGLTLKNSKGSDHFEKFKEFSKDSLNREIDRLSERPTEKVYLSKEDIFDFINATHVNLKILEIEDDELLKKLLDLLESTVNEKDVSNANTDFRRKRDVRDLAGQNMNEDFIRRYAEITLKLLESTYNRQESDKAEIADKVVDLTNQLCRNNKITREKFWTNFAAIDILKLTGNQLNEKNFSIFNPVTSEMGYFNISIQDAKSRDKRYCVGLVQLVEDVFTEEETPTYHIEVIDLSPSSSPDGLIYSTALDDDSIQITLKRNNPQENGCLIRQIGSIDWDRELCTTKSLDSYFTSCQCLRLGFIRLGKVVIPIKATTTTTTPLPAVVATLVSPTSGVIGNPSIQKPRTTTKAPLNGGIQSDAMMTSNNNKVYEANFTSAWYYIIPVLFVAFVLGIVGFFVVNEKRRSYQKRLKAVAQILNLPKRDPQPGINYSRFHDEDLLTGAHFKN
ncbi:hypothetical protein ACFFRR_010719 [Megaselia abdita]